MSFDPTTPPDRQRLAFFTQAQLIDIIGKQQHLIAQLQQELAQARTHGTRIKGAMGNHVGDPTPSVPDYPYLRVQTASSSYPVPLVGKAFWTIGRGADNGIVLPDQWMSRTHAMLQAMGKNVFYLIDLGSHNGSFVNGRRVNIPVALSHGDLLTFGQTNVEFHLPVTLGSRVETLDVTIPAVDDTPATALLHVRRLISVLVVDMRSFTVLTRQLDEHLLSEVVGTWFRHAGEIIRQYGSWVDKYIGDAVMAVWIHGTQAVGREEILQPLQALSALHQITSELHLTYPLPFPLKIGAGLNTGYAMVGNTGSSERPDYTALGDTVNAAFRLETSTKQLELDVALGETTYQYLRQWAGDRLPFRDFTVHWKGYETAVPTYACAFEELNQFLHRHSQL